MIIKPKFQDLKQSQAIKEEPKFVAFLDNADKVFVLVLQAVLLGHLIYQYVVDEVYASKEWISSSIAIGFLAIIFIAFLFEKKSIIVAYSYSLALMAAIPIGRIELLAADILKKLFNPDAPVLDGPNAMWNASIIIMWNLIILLALGLYLSVCFAVIDNIDLKKKKKSMTLPHTVQNVILVQPKDKPIQSI
ncbi:hypothetical protein CAEBREN_19803 [Caenorhabditis brenneri]|uniref:Uncharacterized protein n=1 Tax=Caenorhabditis brenneri TaxID=135651 RepID=G0MK62_CAEBE|nr:hypothetical protein CAEBREN_19803 [Caenorhabditis brenneri]